MIFKGLNLANFMIVVCLIKATKEIKNLKDFEWAWTIYLEIVF